MNDSIIKIIEILQKAVDEKNYIDILVVVAVVFLSVTSRAIVIMLENSRNVINFCRRENVGTVERVVRELKALVIVALPIVGIYIFWLELKISIFSLKIGDIYKEGYFYVLITSYLIVALLVFSNYLYLGKVKYYHILIIISVSAHLCQIIYLCVYYITSRNYRYIELVTRSTVIVSVMTESIVAMLCFLKWRKENYKEQYSIFKKYDRLILILVNAALLFAVLIWEINSLIGDCIIAVCYIYGLVDFIVTTSKQKTYNPRIIYVKTEECIYEAVKVKQKEYYLQMIEIGGTIRIVPNSDVKEIRTDN